MKTNHVDDLIGHCVDRVEDCDNFHGCAVLRDEQLGNTLVLKDKLTVIWL